jgi:hypothetical protein
MSSPTILHATGKNRRRLVTSEQYHKVSQLTANARQLPSTNFCGGRRPVDGFPSPFIVRADDA